MTTNEALHAGAGANSFRIAARRPDALHGRKRSVLILGPAVAAAQNRNNSAPLAD
jgi:hypothetical protein